MTDTEFVRARRPEHKQLRRESILSAARDLALSSGVRNVSLGSVATAAGVAKSNVATYFATREEIYLELVVEGLHDWAGAVTEQLVSARERADVIAALAEPLATRPLFCDLLSHVSTSLEHNVSVAAAGAFKRTAMAIMADLGTQVARADLDLTEQEAHELVTATTLFAGALYPVANPPQPLIELYAQEPELAAARLPFLPALTRILTAIAGGLPALR